MSAAAVFAIFSILFLTRYFNYGAEGIEVGALMRMNAHLPYMSGAAEIPLYLNQYSPYFYAIVHAPISLLQLQSLEATVLCARLVVLATALASIATAYYCFSAWGFSNKSLALVAVWFLILFPANIIAIRPDLLAFFLEFAGLSVWLRSTRSSLNQRTCALVGAGALLGCAVAMKLNTVGVLAGIVLYHASERCWVRGFLFTISATTTAVTFLIVAWVTWGPEALSNTFLSIQNQTDQPGEIAHRLGGLVFYASPLILLMVLGLRARRHQFPEEVRTVSFALTTSFALATLEQLKYGAWYNYYFGFFTIGLGPAATGLHGLLCSAKSQRLLSAVFAMALAHVVWAVRVPLVIVRDRVRNHYPFVEAVTWVEREFPRGPIYSLDSNALLRFPRRTLLGPESEAIVAVTPAFRRMLPEIKANLSKHAFVAGIATGPECDHWRPQGIFLEETARLTQLVRRFGWICVLAPSRAAPRLR